MIHHIDEPGLAEAILSDPQRFGVRPPDQPVPPHLGGGALGSVFARWLRMRDDAGHGPAKAAMIAALARLDTVEIERHARAQSALAWTGGWDHWIWATSIASMAALLGIAPAAIAAQRALLARFHAIARGLAPTASTEHVAAADAACAAVVAALDASAALPLGLSDADAELANRLALLWQSFEAGAALLGQAVAELAQDPALRRPGAMADWLPAHVAAHGVLLNTRRFACGDATVGDLALQRGDGLVVGLRAHPFGHGPHLCPGQRVALAIAAAALEAVLEAPDVAWPDTWQDLTLPNARIPFFKESSR